MNWNGLPRLAGTAMTMLVLLTACGDGAEEVDVAEGPAASAPAEPAPMPAAPSAMDAGGAMLDPEQASRDELLAVPGMDAAAADALVAGRPYENMLAVDEVLAAHLDEGEREAAYASLWKPLDLNSAPSEEIMLIPGMDERMTHEFEEYRPYTEMEEFQTEIGKYVDQEEVARLQRYVTIR
jgi:DNA uptake protein ComE-like DNA-binding protein